MVHGQTETSMFANSIGQRLIRRARSSVRILDVEFRVRILDLELLDLHSHHRTLNKLALRMMTCRFASINVDRWKCILQHTL